MLADLFLHVLPIPSQKGGPSPTVFWRSGALWELRCRFLLAKSSSAAIYNIWEFGQRAMMSLDAIEASMDWVARPGSEGNCYTPSSKQSRPDQTDGRSSILAWPLVDRPVSKPVTKTGYRLERSRKWRRHGCWKMGVFCFYWIPLTYERPILFQASHPRLSTTIGSTNLWTNAITTGFYPLDAPAISRHWQLISYLS